MMNMEAMLSTESCLMEDQSGQSGADALPAEESLRASIAMDTMEMEAATAVSGVPCPPIHRSIQCRGATPMARGKHNIDAIVLHTPEGYVPGTLSVLSGTRAGFDFFLPPSGELYKCNDYLRYFSWQAGDLAYNRRSIGIEQWDFARNMPNAPDAHYQRLARLCAYLVETLDLAVRHAKNYGEHGFIAHGTITPNARWDPGNFDYDKLLSLVSDLVKGRPEEKLAPVGGNPNVGDPNVGDPTNGRPKIWLPGVERVAAGAFDESHLGKAHVITLDGSERAVIVPKGVAMDIPRPGEPDESEAPEIPIVVPVDDPNGSGPVDPEGKRLAAVIDSYFAALPSNLAPYAPVGAIIYDEAKKANLHITSACALVEQESAGRNVFGADWGTRHADAIPFAHLPVTKARVQKLVAHVRAGGVSNGVGLTQITWRDFIYDAENRGGAHLPKNQCSVGFGLLAGYYGRYPYLEAIGAYNAGESARQSVIGTYSKQFAQKHEAWRARLGVAGEPPPATAPETTEPPSEPTIPPEEAPNTPHGEAPLGETPLGTAPPGGTPREKAPLGEAPLGGEPSEGAPHGEAPPKDESPVGAPPVTAPPVATTPPMTAPPVATMPPEVKPPVMAPPVATTPPVALSPGTPAKAPVLGKAAKAIVAAAVPLVGALLLWAQTGTLSETEFTVALTGLLTALIVYFVPNSTDGNAKN